MFSVYLWISKDSTELLGFFPDQYNALEFMVSYAHLHCISLDKLTLGHATSDMICDIVKENY